METCSYSLELKPDMADAAQRWDAFWQGEVLDRPLLMLTAPVPGFPYMPGADYRDLLFADVNDAVERSLHNLRGTIYGAESMPAFWGSVATDSIATMCGAEVVVGEAGNTTWTDHPVKDWPSFLPLAIDESSQSWRRTEEVFRTAARALEGKALMFHIDSHFNMDLLMGLRGSESLCLDLYDEPESVERALQQTIPIFQRIWSHLEELCDMKDRGYWFDGYSREPLYMQACDFSAMMSPEMFRRMVVPVLEAELSIIGGRSIYHWDGPDAIRHCDALTGIRNLHTFSYVPSPGRSHVEQVELYKTVQARGKAVYVSGSVDELKHMHGELDPRLTIYSTNLATRGEMDRLIRWFADNT